MKLESPRLNYRKFTKKDFELFFSWYGDDEVMQHVTGKALSKPQAKARFEYALALNKEKKHAGLFAVFLKEDEQFIGIVKFTYLKKRQVEIGYGMLPSFWNKGFGTEMLDSLIKHAQQKKKIKELIGIVSPTNKASIKILTNRNFEAHMLVKEGDRPSKWFKLIL